MRVLVVEDDKRIADGLVAHLAGHGHAVDTAGNLATGWAALCAEPFDLLLLDLGLPDGDGASLLARLRAAPAGGLPDAHTPVLVMTADDNPSDQAALLRAGANDLVSKPVEERLLITKLLFQLRVGKNFRKTQSVGA